MTAYKVAEPSRAKTFYPECTFAAGDGSAWWGDIDMLQSRNGIEYRPWVDGNTIIAYWGQSPFLKIVESPSFPTQWVTTHTYQFAGHQFYSKLGAVCSFVKSGRN